MLTCFIQLQQCIKIRRLAEADHKQKIRKKGLKEEEKEKVVSTPKQQKQKALRTRTFTIKITQHLLVRTTRASQRCSRRGSSIRWLIKNTQSKIL